MKQKFKYAKGKSKIYQIKTEFTTKPMHGKDIELPIKKHKFFISKYVYDNDFVISELSTGRELSRADTEDECVTLALIHFFAHGQRDIDRRIKSAIKEHGIINK